MAAWPPAAQVQPVYSTRTSTRAPVYSDSHDQLCSRHVLAFVLAPPPWRPRTRPRSCIHTDSNSSKYLVDLVLERTCSELQSFVRTLYSV